MKTVAIWAAILLAGGWGFFLIGTFAYIAWDGITWTLTRWRVTRGRPR